MTEEIQYLLSKGVVVQDRSGQNNKKKKKRKKMKGKKKKKEKPGIKASRDIEDVETQNDKTSMM